jgi:hypothetical protein
MLAALLPSSSIDLSSGWTRPRNILTIPPTINFYAKEDIDNLMKTPSIAQIPKFFIASHDFSIPMIKMTSTKEGPSVLLTSNEKLADFFRQAEMVRVVSYKDTQSLDVICGLCYRALIDVFISHAEKTFSETPVTAEFYDAYCLQKRFLPQTFVTQSLLCAASELVLAQCRGKIPHLGGEERQVPEGTQDAYRRNIEMMREIALEKTLDLVLGVNREASGIVVRKIPQLLNERIAAFLADSSELSDEKKLDGYRLLKELVLQKITEIDIRAEIELTVFIPTVNPSCRQRITQELQNQVKTEPSVLENLLDLILSGGRMVPFVADDSQLSKISSELALTRLSENRALTYLVAILASRKLSPVLKCITAPSSLFYELEQIQDRIGSGYLSETKNPIWRSTTGELFRSMQTSLSAHLSREYIGALNLVGNMRLTIVSDLPFELAFLKNDLSICQNLPTSRLPLTPSRELLQYYNRLAMDPFVIVDTPSLKDVMLVNSIHEQDPLYPEFQLFNSTASQVGLDFQVETAYNSDDFLSAVNSHAPKILAYFGHGTYNPVLDRGELVFRDDTMSYELLDKLTHIPSIVFLIGCETASCSAFLGGLPAHLLGQGVQAILATLFPIPAQHAAAFLGRTLAFCNDVIRVKGSIRLSNLIFEARKLGWLLDNLDAMQMSGIITWKEMLAIMEEFGKDAMEEWYNDRNNLLIAEAIPLFEGTLARMNLLNSWKNIRNSVIPYSLFFTLLGNAHDVSVCG